MRLILSVIFFISFLPAVKAQRTCNSDIYAKELIRTGLINAPVPTARLRDTIADEIITIPVVIHLIYNNTQQNISNEQVLSQLEALNKDFSMLNMDAGNVPAAFKARAADIRIQFCLAKVDPNGRLTTGIIRRQTNKTIFLGDDAMKFTAAGGDDAWDPQRYLNIWVCNMFGRSLGYATIPGAPADKDGIVINWDVFGTKGAIRPPFNKGRTATHEIAHWLGLKHIWGDDICSSDDVDDTPPQKSYNFYCPVFPKVSDCSSDGNGDMFMNYMDLTDDACMIMFTHGQKKKMRGQFALNGYRNSFLNSMQCDSSLATGGPLPEDLPIFEPLIPNVKVYPNPVYGKLNIVAENNFTLEGKLCSIYDIRGKVVFQNTFKGHMKNLDLSLLMPGVYFLQVGEGADKKIFKLVKM